MSEQTEFGQALRAVLNDPGNAANALDLADLIREWTADELDIIGYLRDRLLLGREHYGPLDLDLDDREWGIEQAEEHEDAVVYAGAAYALRLRRRESRPTLRVLPRTGEDE
jgi:hypothetical protein